MSQRHRRRKLVFGTWLCVIGFGVSAAGTHAASAQPGELAGHVADDAGRPLPGASVVLESSGRPRYGTATNRQGEFSIAPVQEGFYDLIVTYVGHATERRIVRIAGGRRVDLELRLTSYTLSQEEVVVTATRARRTIHPITFSNLTARDLEQQPSMKDLPIILSSLPSVTHHSENGNGVGYSTLRMRGFDQRRVAVAINGIPQNDPEDFNVFWINFFDLQGATEDVQVQRGAGSSFYGPTAIGGAINIVALPYKPHAFVEVDIGAGTYDTRRYTIQANSGLVGDRFVAFGRFSRLLSDGYRDWSWTEFYRFFAGVTRYGNRSSLTLQAYGGPQRDALAFSGIPKAANDSSITDALGTVINRKYNFSAFTEDLEQFHQPHVELLHEWDLSSRVAFHQALFWVKGEGYFDFGGTFRSADYLRLPQGYRNLSEVERALPLFVVAPDVQLLFRAYLDQWQVGWLPHVSLRHGRGETTVGGEMRLHRSIRWGRIEEAGGVPASLVGAEHDVRVYSFRGEKVISSLYGRHLTRLNDAVALQADVQLTFRQYRVYDEAFFGHEFKKPYAFVNPRVGLTLFPEQSFSAYASVALAHREPRLKSLYDGEEAGAGFTPRFERDAGGALDYDRPLVGRERLLDVELGAAIHRDAWRATANGFWMEFDDEIVPSGGLDQFGVPRSGNADRTRHVGLEVVAMLRPASWIEIFGNATLSRNRIIKFTEFVSDSGSGGVGVRRDGNPIAGFPERLLNAGALVQRKGASLRVDVKYAGTQYIDNSGAVLPSGEPYDELIVDPYALVDATLQYRPSIVPNLRLSLDVNNVLDKKILLYGNVGPAGPQFFPTARRHLFFSARYRLQ